MEEAGNRTSGFFGGVLVFLMPGSSLGFETGALYVPKGAAMSVDGATGALEISYLEIPALRFALPLQNSNVTSVIMLGGSLGLKTGCKVSAESGGASAAIDCDDSLFERELDIKTVDIGIAGGVALDTPIAARAALSPSVRYTRGISDIVDNEDVKNSAFQIGVAVRFTL